MPKLLESILEYPILLENISHCENESKAFLKEIETEEKARRFVVTLPCSPDIWQKHIIEKRFRLSEKAYNALVRVVMHRHNAMIRDPEYKTTPRVKMLKKYGLNSSASFQQLMKPIYKHYNEKTEIKNPSVKRKNKKPDYKKRNIYSSISQNLANQVYESYKKMTTGNGKIMHFKKYGQLETLANKNRKDGMEFFEDESIFDWDGLKMFVIIKTDYEREALNNSICFYALERRLIRGEWKYYVQFTLRGIPPIKRNKHTGEVVHPLGKGNVGIDIGTQTIAVVSDKKVLLAELADKIPSLQREIRIIQRKMDRSRRSTNPDYFNKDGTIKKLPKGTRRQWNNSNNYIHLRNQYRELCRKQSAVRLYLHWILANEITSMGDTHNVEKMNFAALAKKAKKQSSLKDDSKPISSATDSSTNKKKAKPKRRKRFGKSIGHKAPATLLLCLDCCLRRHGKKLNKINTYKVKASQLNHKTGECTKKALSQRWTEEIDGIRIQRDLYSAFLIKNAVPSCYLIPDNIDSVDLKKCEETFKAFVILHNSEIKRVQEYIDSQQKRSPVSLGLKKSKS